MQHLYKDFYINRKQVLGIGSFGKVYIGEWRRTDGTIKIAIK